MGPIPRLGGMSRLMASLLVAALLAIGLVLLPVSRAEASGLKRRTQST